MDYKNISAGELASILEVQRSNISHVLNGRNKPGAAFIEKFLVCFPDMNARWLLTGEGSMTEDNVGGSAEEPVVNKISATSSEKKVEIPVTAKYKNKAIEKVVILYTDGTFSDYSNNKDG